MKVSRAFGILMMIGAAVFIVWTRQGIMHQKVQLKTEDGVTISGDYYAGRGAEGVLLLHMMPATKASWKDFAPRLREQGMHVLAIDLRGHGDSDGGPTGYKTFSDAEHQAGIKDVAAGVAFLMGHGVAPDSLSIIGASIGANLAIRYAGEHEGVRNVIALSPGIDYRGVLTEPYLGVSGRPRRILFVTSKDDGNNVAMTRRLYEITPQGTEKRIIEYTNAGHGTDMFGKEMPDVAAESIQWLRAGSGGE